MVPGDQGQSMTHPYSHEIQLKLYQAFIFSIPILFSIILFLLFYLFYLKRRAYILTTSPSIVPRTFRHPNGPTSFVTLTCEMNLKGELKENLPKVLFDEELKARDSVCCVCLGEFEMKEELIQVPSCKHMFHVECISHWLQSNSTCPLCRCSVAAAAAAAAAAAGPSPSIQPNLQQAHINIPNHHQQLSTVAAATVLSEEPSSSSSSNTTTTTAMGCSTLSVESVVVHIRPLDS